MSSIKKDSVIALNLGLFEKMKLFLDNILEDSVLREELTGSSKNFTRDSKLNLPYLAGLILNLLKRSLGVELQESFGIIHNGRVSCTKSAFSQQRTKLLPAFFDGWNKVLVDIFYENYGKHVRKWKGYTLQAVDGSTAYLFDKGDVKAYFGTQLNQYGGKPMARVMQIFDVFNNIVVLGIIRPIIESEQAIMSSIVNKLPKNSLTLFDRGYPSFALMYLLLLQPDCKFLMRCTVGFNKEVKKFINSRKSSKIIELSATDTAIVGLKNHGHDITKDTKIKIRMVKFKLPSGIVEVLLTNLYDEKRFTIGDLKHLYGLRWGIETAYDKQKNQQQMEQFSGHRVICVQQDYAATIITANIQSLIEKQSDTFVKEKSEGRMYEYKINKNVSFGALKHNIVKIFLTKNPKEILVILQTLFEQNLEPVRPGRSNPRKEKSVRSKGKFQTFTNFKRAV